MELLRRYSNRPDLLGPLVRVLEKIKNGPLADDPEDHIASVTGNVAGIWRISDRLTPADIDELVATYLAGSTVKQLAEQYGIGTTTVKRILRRQEARKTPLREKAQVS